ncbi:MAG TPA: M56 family metallopeptidase [Candidatus Elarobacter sp.]|nr:M56 family metallopeptidase [Candidatus Elarobacter sp.]
MNALVNQAVLAIASVVLTGLWQGVLIAGAVWLVLRSLRGLGAATRHAVWLCALVALLVVPVVTAALTARQPAPSRSATPPGELAAAPAHRVAPVDHAVITTHRRAIAPASRAADVRAADGTSADVSPAAARTAEDIAASATASAPLGRARIAIPEPLAAAVALVWLLAACARFLKLAFAVRELGAIRRSAAPWSSSHAYPVLVSPRVGVPVAFGFVRPAVVLPAALAGELGTEAMESIIVHESAHLQRLDVWTNALARVVEALLALNPAAWFVMRRVSAEREIACDDCVVTRTGSGDAFARVIADLATRIGEPAPLVAASAAGTTRSTIVTRIECLLDASPRRLRLSSAGLGAALGSLAVVAVLTQSISPVLAYAAQPAQPPLVADAGAACPSPSRGLPTMQLMDPAAAIARFGAAHVVTFALDLDRAGKPRDVRILSTAYPDVAAHVKHVLMINRFQPVLRDCAPVAGTIRSAAVIGPRHPDAISLVQPVYPAGWSAAHGSSCKVPDVIHAGVPAYPAVSKPLPLGAEYNVAVRVHVGAQGAVTSATLVQRSGYRAFDAALLAAARGETYPLADETGFRPVRPAGTSLAWNAAHGSGSYAHCSPLPRDYVWHTTFSNGGGFVLASRFIPAGATWR